MRLEGLQVTFVAASRQNVFFEELELALRVALESLGASVRRVVDVFPAPADGEVFVVVPHEFVSLTEPEVHPDDAQLARTLALATEQPGTRWFELSRALCARAAATVDINRVGADALRAAGVEARYLPLGYCPAWDAWRGDVQAPRPRDVLFLGGFTTRRARALARCADVLARHESGIFLVDNASPLGSGTPGVETGDAKWRLFAGSKALLNVHRSREGYFEWHRAISAIVNGCVVVTDHALDVEPLRPGVDYV